VREAEKRTRSAVRTAEKDPDALRDSEERSLIVRAGV
jgi:hypothetical protein